MFRQLMGESPPPVDRLPERLVIEFDRRAMEFAWVRIREATHQVRPVTIWTNHPFRRANDPLWTGHRLLAEADWVLNEAPDLALVPWLSAQTGPHTLLIQNLCGWPTHDAALWPQVDPSRYGFYGFARADPLTTLPDGEPANSRNIEIIRAAYRRLETLRGHAGPAAPRSAEPPGTPR